MNRPHQTGHWQWALVVVAVTMTCLAQGLPAAPQAQAATTQDAFTRLLADVSAFRGRGFTLPLPPGTPSRYANRMEDVSEARFAAEASALAGFAERLNAPVPEHVGHAHGEDSRVPDAQPGPRRDRAEIRGAQFRHPLHRSRSLLLFMLLGNLARLPHCLPVRQRPA